MAGVRPIIDRMQSLQKLISYTRDLRGLFIIIGLTSLIGAAVSLVTPFVIKLATDWVVSIIGGQAEFTWQAIAGFLGLFVGLAIIAAVASDVGGWFGDMMSIRARRQLSDRYYRHLFTLSQHYYDGEVTGKIINRLTRAISEITRFLQFFSNNLLQMLLTMVVTIIILGFYNWVLAVLFLVLIPINLLLTAKTSVKWQRYETKINHHFDIASGRFAEVVGQMRLVKSFGTQSREAAEFDGRLGKMVDLTAKQSRYWHVMNAYRSLAFGLINAAIMGILFYSAARGSITLGDMVMLLTLIQQATFPLRNLSFFVDSYQRAVSNSRDYITALEEQPETDPSTRKLTVDKGEVELRDVNFAYEDKKQVLHNISFRIRPGQKLALVGESGGGKSTIANLVMRLYDPSSGQVLIDGQSIDTFSRSSVRSNIATVFQESALFSGTVRENITYAQPNASNESIEKAARAANAWKFISELPDGLDTEIGERGIKLSGGQKQRISIARALLKDAPILILDEATSALDSRSEQEVQQALNRLMKNRTTMIIAHRLSTIANVDTIVTLAKGRVDEIGSPKDLAQTGGIYAELLSLQLGSNDEVKQHLAKYDISA